VKVAGVKVAGVKDAGVKVAGVKDAGVKVAGVKDAGVKAISVKAAVSIFLWNTGITAQSSYQLRHVRATVHPSVHKDHRGSH